jgi:hypothetical protein
MEVLTSLLIVDQPEFGVRSSEFGVILNEINSFRVVTRVKKTGFLGHGAEVLL